jgi:molybdenum cofactor cytidylyltransferase
MFRSFAVVPAAGTSARMGAPKLLLPLGGRAIIERVLASWTGSRVTRTVVVVRPGDEALLERCRAMAVDVVVPRRAPADMKASVVAAIEHIESTYSPAAADTWLVAPADMPALASEAIDAVLDAYDVANPTATAPTFEGRRGHPLLMPWGVAADVAALRPDEGVNALARRLPMREVAWADRSILHDVDTPEDIALMVRGAMPG